MENGGAFFRRNTGKLQFFERTRWHGGNLRPMLDDFGCQTTCLADFTVGGVMFELKLKQFQRQRIKISEGRVTQAPIRALKFRVRASRNPALRKEGLAQTRGEV